MKRGIGSYSYSYSYSYGYDDAETLTFVPTGETYFSVTPCCNGVFTVDSNVNPEWDAEESRYYYISVTCS